MREDIRLLVQRVRLILMAVFLAISATLPFNTPASAIAGEERIVFSSSDNLIYSMAPDGSDIREEYAMNIEGYYLTPDGSKTVYAIPGEYDVLISNRDGTNVVNLTNTPDVEEFVLGVSPNGQKIAYGRQSNSDPNVYGMFVMNIDGSSSVRVADETGVVSWFPNSQKFATEQYVPATASRVIKIINVNGTEESTLSAPGESWNAPSVSPDGTSILFRSYLDEPPQNVQVDVINKINVDGTGREVVYSHGDGEWFEYSLWSPDGQSMVIMAGNDYDPVLTIKRVPLDGGQSTNLYTGSVDRILQWIKFTDVVIDTDTTAPSLAAPSWTTNPKSVQQSTTLTTHATDAESGVQNAEYFIGDNDPGQGNGATMTLANQQSGGADLTTTFGTDFPTGVYKISVRAQDVAGNWSEPVSDYLVVYDVNSPTFKGKRSIVPGLSGGDVLPGLISTSQTDKAKFGFVVKYNNQGQISNNSDLQFSYSTGTHCNNPNNAQNCHDMALNAAQVSWLTTQDTNNSTGIFQGTATMTVDGQNTNILFRVTGRDGERLNPTATDQFQLQIFNVADNPNTATPIYKINSADIARGNIKLINN